MITITKSVTTYDESGNIKGVNAVFEKYDGEMTFNITMPVTLEDVNGKTFEQLNAKQLETFARKKIAKLIVATADTTETAE